ncbi:MAG: biosynthetic-type acetolactate synthase large subunit [Pseudomonadota bacterium]|jgi:acetolactate synthase-1/2/3 large subunit|nr:biosynthetic-type acetolactate synthase large subunit [Pseudomonadota bacterium]|tara:strand:- start:2550 stop:4289 length:1740 start_codon:yes stop_codon:yes gene_type:complete
MDKNMTSGGEALIRALSDEKIDIIFGYPGGAALHIYDAIYQQDKVQHILVRHEQAAVHAADGFARATGKTGVALVTSGPGATNAITGIATAYMDSIPLVVISGQVASHLIGTDAFQETDMIGISRPIVKHSFLVQSAEEIPAIVKKAFHIASSGRPGPVVIDVPKDMTDPKVEFEYKFPKDLYLRSYPILGEADQTEVSEAVKMLKTAKKPVIYSGGGVIQSDASQELVNLSKMIGAPVTNTLMGLGAFPATDNQFVGMLGMHGTYEANMVMSEADLIFNVGARFDDRITNNPKKFGLEAKKIHIDSDPSSIDKIINVDVALQGDAKLVLSQLCKEFENSELANTNLKPWWDQINEWKEKHGLNHDMLNLENQKDIILPQQVIQSLYKVTKGEAFITSDVGQHQMFAAQYYKFDEPRKWINSGGLGTMGFGLPSAMGVKFAFPDADVACVTGEGSIQMCIQELSTCSQYGLPVKIINLNNRALGMVKQWQDMQYGGRYSSISYEDSLPDFVKLAESFGHVGLKVEKFSELNAAMEEAFSLKDKLVFLDVLIDPDEHVYPMLEAGGSMSEMRISKKDKTF